MKNYMIFLAISLFMFAPILQGVDSTKSDAQTKAANLKQYDTNQQLVKSIRQAILADRTLSTYAAKVAIKADKGGVITLSGNVDTLKAKSDIESKAKGVSGVSQVTNHIVVKPSTPQTTPIQPQTTHAHK